MNHTINNSPTGLVHESGVWRGVLSFETLYVGSKSEGVYLTLDSTDSRKYRVAVSDLPADGDVIRIFIGKLVEIQGVADNLRGHWRIVTDIASIVEISCDGSEENQIKSI